MFLLQLSEAQILSLQAEKSIILFGRQKSQEYF